jgi:hypothetical protein
MATLSSWSYLKCFLLAVSVEIIALLSLVPGLATIGTSHSANAPSNPLATFSERAGFILHLPTILLTLPFKDSRLPIIFLTPLGQIAFLTAVFIYIARRRSQRKNVSDEV